LNFSNSLGSSASSTNTFLNVLAIFYLQLLMSDSLKPNAHGNGRSTWSASSRNNAEGMRELARSVERPSEPQANELTYLLGASRLTHQTELASHTKIAAKGDNNVIQMCSVDAAPIKP
jgi:hypothetical protein